MPAWVGQILASRILGIKYAWNNWALFDLQDYFLNTPPTAGYFFDDFVHAMWDTYREVYVSADQISDHPDFLLDQNFPNPFSHATTIYYQVQKSGFYTLKLYDIFGKEIATLLSENKTAGKYHVELSASKLPIGTYVYELKSEEFISAKKCVVIK